MQVTSAPEELVTAPEGKAPLRSGTADLPIVGDHVIAAVLAHTGELRVRRRCEMTEDDFGSQFRIGIAEEKCIHCRLGQHSAGRLNLHTEQIADLQ